MKTKTDNFISSLLCGLLVLLFVYTGFAKLLDLEESRDQMLNQVFPKPVALFLLWTVPIGELSVALLIYIPKTRIVGLWAHFIIMTLFTLYVLFALLGVYDRVPCNCGGIFNTMGWITHLIVNIAFMFIGAAAIYLVKQERRY